MAQATQSGRHIAVATPLGEDVLLLRRFSGHEELSRLPEFDLDLLSEDQEVNFDDIVGQNVTVRMTLPGGSDRFWNGYITRFVQVPAQGVQYAHYCARMSPWPWFLSRTADCRIFQGKTVPEIVKELCADLGFTDIEDRLSGGYRTWVYCVQYRETAFNFISRLMEQEGIYYYFRHEEGKATLVLCDSLSKHDPYEDYSEILYDPEADASSISEHIKEWVVEKEIRPGKYAQTDYNFTQSRTALLSNTSDVKGHAMAECEIFEFPGEYSDLSEGDRYAAIRMEEMARSHEVCRGKSESRGLCPGYKFTMARHPRGDQNREYLVVSADYEAAAESYETSGGGSDTCKCSFETIPGDVQFRPGRMTRKPVLQGSQTAVVVGPAGEEIYTDEFGRVKVQFHWDRYGKRDENSSCWIRVSQVHAGKAFGGVDIPRIGEEVVVDFIEGDPDQPLISGRVYNDDQTVPFGLPDKKVVSGMKSNSTKGGGGYNEFTLDDTKGTEKIVVHGQYDMLTTIEHDQTDTVHNNRTATVDVDDSESVGNNQTVAVGNDQSLTVGNNQTNSIGTDQTSSVGSNQSLVVGSTRSVSVGSDETKNVGSNQTVTVGSNQMVSAGGDRSVVVGGADDLSVATDRTVTLGGSESLTAGAKVEITAGATITLTAGGSSIEIGPGGVTISSPAIISLKGAMVKNN